MMAAGFTKLSYSNEVSSGRPAGVTPASTSSTNTAKPAGGSNPRIEKLEEELHMSFRETKLVLVAADLAGYVRATAGLEALALGALLDEWYRRSSRIVRAHGGRVV